MSGLNFPPELRIYFEDVIESSPYAANFAIAAQTGEGHVDCTPARNIQKIHRAEKAFPSPNRSIPRNYLIPHGLHGRALYQHLEKLYYFL